MIEDYGSPGQIRTADLRFRKPLLYPSELQGRKEYGYYRMTNLAGLTLGEALPLCSLPTCVIPFHIQSFTSQRRPARVTSRSRNGKLWPYNQKSSPNHLATTSRSRAER